MVERAAQFGHVKRRVLLSGICLGVLTCVAFAAPEARAESLPEALAKAYQTNPALNAERARQRATDENVPQALAGYRPQIVASLSAGLQSVRDLLPGNTIQSANLKPWQIGVTVTQVLFNGFKTGNQSAPSRGAGVCRPRGAALLWSEQNVLLDTVPSPSWACWPIRAWSRHSAPTSQFLRELRATTHSRRYDAGDVTPTDVAQSEARLNCGIADLNNAEIALAVSQATYAQVVGNAPSQLRPAEIVDRLRAAQPR